MAEITLLDPPNWGWWIGVVISSGLVMYIVIKMMDKEERDD